MRARFGSCRETEKETYSEKEFLVPFGIESLKWKKTHLCVSKSSPETHTQKKVLHEYLLLTTHNGVLGSAYTTESWHTLWKTVNLCKTYKMENVNKSRSFKYFNHKSDKYAVTSVRVTTKKIVPYTPGYIYSTWFKLCKLADTQINTRGGERQSDCCPDSECSSPWLYWSC